MTEKLLAQFKEKSDKSLVYLKEKLGTIRSGRANPALVADLKVNCYGSQMVLKTVAAITAPEPRLIVIQPWDQTVVSAVEKAIQTSNLGLTPQTEDNIVRVAIPNLTAERRDELIKLVGQETENLFGKGVIRFSSGIFEEIVAPLFHFDGSQ